MKFIKIDPPGTFCFYRAVMDVTSNLSFQSFVDVGCGAGDLSKKFLEKGKQGIGVDFSQDALKVAGENLADYIKDEKFTLVNKDIMAPEKAREIGESDLGYSMMVMEHVEDDIGFLHNIMAHVCNGGHVMVAVPGRADCWGIEDETVGHVRRYDKDVLERVLEKAGLVDVRVISVSVPLSNFLFGLSNFMVRLSRETDKKTLSMREQTQSSGIREIPFKTVFPRFFRFILNDVTLYPLYILQRFFYGTGLGLTMLGIGRIEN